MPISEWFQKKGKYLEVTPKTEKRPVPDGIWSKCAECGEIIYQKELVKNLWVCPKCNFHYKLSAYDRLGILLDGGEFNEFDASISSDDPLKFKAEKTYLESLNQSKEKTNLNDAVVTVKGKIDGRPVIIAVMDFRFIGGSMGSVVGEKITRAAERAIEGNSPLIIVSSSGGARMQEGMFSLMQMAKTSAAIAHFKETGLPYISVLTNPTMGGVMASFASLGDVIIAEPQALIGFAGPRVIEKTIRQRLPKDFQKAEFMLDYGQVDLVVDRNNLKATISKLLDSFMGGLK
ncbi:acetyl-CoA carboxylase, carboxyltransferase subunit beta [Candidatus Oleimmundimicrobium sp.]|uniref:acetyl-CoA carboxylase, carboxyltransferase subunit beta n=1 Tax=Candidatus Oleimmundimicrobium sp. TaxID=3060597 RepID=UPI0027209386|nr:acetyl-CoA carboxylase, carboxyltransferase subunit beta [Candidatus Oleimmundimicrobium sp.]MDO8886654.1 acetyl-CoA carboxylase, carboxyltransferase subunit beta [Candidatus Oleimmundimicrobium sp.]